MAVVAYLHGFNSSPLSNKAELTRQYLTECYPQFRFQAPAIPDKPADAIPFLEEWAGKTSLLGLVGGSLGGYYATWLAEKHDLPAVLVNPAVRPFDLVSRYGAEQQNPYSGERYKLDDNDEQLLRGLYVEALELPERFKVLLQTGDETLDYRLAAEKFRESLLTIEQGGDHRFQNYQQHLPSIVEFMIGFRV